jgi:hypothetical protein
VAKSIFQLDKKAGRNQPVPPCFFPYCISGDGVFCLFLVLFPTEEIELGEFVLDDLEGAMEIAGAVEDMQSFELLADTQAFCAQDVIFLHFDLFAHGPLPP